MPENDKGVGCCVLYREWDHDREDISIFLDNSVQGERRNEVNTVGGTEKNAWIGVCLKRTTTRSKATSLPETKGAGQGPKLTFFGRRQVAPIFFPNGKMWSPKSVGKTFPLQRNTSQNYWSPQACRQDICNRCNQESNQSWNHHLTTLTDLPCHILTLREYLILCGCFISNL